LVNNEPIYTENIIRTMILVIYVNDSYHFLNKFLPLKRSLLF